ncbi:DNA-directed RNA polymerase III subunit RPC5 [Hyposmocoma kahamanoa]|uniref:DNA-directed RNA polymerase III subunit RPC5 n=1 Tax=Hyposmocoma kahamanoa TaxID=1477025 RepID=UPI000E6D9689|nr:DNA-directed RNA polymerase III subunit RPC5 [Hyposmocoma kahamanoa]
MIEDDDDPVVDEIPIFLSQALTDCLYVYQYPVRPANKDWESVHVAKASFKPKNQIVRLEISLDIDSDKYSASKGEQIAINTDGMQDLRFVREKDRDKAPYFQNCVMDKIVYESSMPCTDIDHYAVAILQDKELHLTPIKGILQLRPSCSYFDKQDKKKHDKNKTDNSDDEEKEPEAQQVIVKFARQETELAKKAREKSYETLIQKINAEPWYNSLWKHSDSDHADLERLKLFSATTSDGVTLNMPGREYLRVLVPPPLHEEADAKSEEILPLVEQIKRLLISAKLMTFNDLQAQLRFEEGVTVSESTLLATLGGVACCVRGLWTPRSADLYTRAGPVPPRLMCAARDHVLYLFTQHPYVDRRKVAAAVRLPPEDVLEIMQSITKYNPRTGWELLIPADIAFEAKYPDIIQRQNLYWEARQRQFNEMQIGENIPKRQRKKSQRDSVGSDIMSPKPRCNSVSDEDSGRKVKGKGVGKRTRNMSSSSVQDFT